MLTEAEWTVIWLSVQTAGLAVAGTLPVGLFVAHVLARRRGALPFALDNLVQLPLVLPPVVTGWLLLALVGPQGPVGGWLEAAGVQIAFTWLGAALAAGVVAFPFLVQTIRVTLEQIDPAWEETAVVFGASRWQVFRYVTLPLSARGVAAATILAFARAMGEFGATIVLAGNIPSKTRTLPLAIFTQMQLPGGEVGAVRLVLFAVGLSVLSLVAHALLTRRLHRHPGSLE